MSKSTWLFLGSLALAVLPLPVEAQQAGRASAAALASARAKENAMREPDSASRTSFGTNSPRQNRLKSALYSISGRNASGDMEKFNGNSCTSTRPSRSWTSRRCR